MRATSAAPIFIAAFFLSACNCNPKPVPDAGTDDDYQFCPPNERLSKVMTEQGHKHLFRKVEGGGHAFSSESMKDNVATSLRFCAAAFAGKDAVAELTPKPAVLQPAEQKRAGDGK